MKPSNRDEELIKLDERLDSLLSDDQMLKRAETSKSAVFRAASALIQSEQPKLDDAMRARMRAKMLAAVPETVPAKTKVASNKKPVLRPSFGNWAARIAAVVLIFLFVGLISPPALANSLPGDALYGLKRGAENVELAFAFTPDAQVEVHFKQSERRVDENKRLLDSARFDASVMQDALNSLDMAIRIANDNNLFETNPALELRAMGILGDVQETLDIADAAQQLDSTAFESFVVAGESLQAYLPSTMQEPSNSSEVTIIEATEPVVPTNQVEIVEVTETTVVEETATEEIQSIDTVQVEDETGDILYVNANGRVNVRDGAGTAYDVVAQLNPNSAVTVLSNAGDWTRIRLEDGQEGWIAAFLLSETINPVNLGTSSTGTGGAGQNQFGCEERGNSCNATGNANGNNNGNNNGNANGNSDGSNNGRGNGRNNK